MIVLKHKLKKVTKPTISTFNVTLQKRTHIHIHIDIGAGSMIPFFYTGFDTLLCPLNPRCLNGLDLILPNLLSLSSINVFIYFLFSPSSLLNFNVIFPHLFFIFPFFFLPHFTLLTSFITIFDHFLFPFLLSLYFFNISPLSKCIYIYKKELKVLYAMILLISFFFLDFLNTEQVLISIIKEI